MLGYWSLNEASSCLPSWRGGPALVIPVARNNNIPKHQGRPTTYPVWSSVFMFDTSTVPSPTFNQERSRYVSCNVRVCSLTALKDPCMILSLGESQRTKTLVDCASRDETNYASSRETQHIPAFISRKIFFLFEQPYGSDASSSSGPMRLSRLVEPKLQSVAGLQVTSLAWHRFQSP